MATNPVYSVIVPEVLTEDNYETWSVCIQNYLLSQDLWNIVETESTPTENESKSNSWRKKNAMALHAIQISCGPKILYQIMGKSAKEAWDFLAEKYSPQIQGNKQEGVYMEELHKWRKVEKNQARQGSSSTTTEEAEKIVVQVDVMSGLTSLREKRFKSVLDAKDGSRSQSQAPNKQIQKVPFMLQDIKDFEKCFEPMVVSIGPYHYGKAKLKPMEMLKLKFTKRFVEGCPTPIEVLYDEIFKKIKKLRDCYEEEPTRKYNDESLAWMLFVDGCFVLHYIQCYTTNKLKQLITEDSHVAFVHHDLFLLENQLPFGVLKTLLMTAKYSAKEGEAPDNIDKAGMKTLEEFVQMIIRTPLPKFRRQQQPAPPGHSEKPSHLLDLLRKRLIGNNTNKNTGSTESKNWNSFRNVTELTELGIRLKASDTNCLRDVSFIPARFIFGDLKLPPIKVDEWTRQKLLNFMAYEMSPGVATEMEVTTYICFLESLIDHADDVKQLRKAGILFNFLGSDEEVAQLFNDITICPDLMLNDAMYQDIKAAIQKHCDRERKSPLAAYFHRFANDPGTRITLMFASMGLYISVIQTYFTINPPHK